MSVNRKVSVSVGKLYETVVLAVAFPKVFLGRYSLVALGPLVPRGLVGLPRPSPVPGLAVPSHSPKRWRQRAEPNGCRGLFSLFWRRLGGDEGTHLSRISVIAIRDGGQHRMSAGSEDGGHEWSAAFATASTDGMEAYDDALVGPVFTPWGEYLLDALTLNPGERLLDVATGPGTVARLASARLGPAGHVLATDLSAAMLAIAEAKGTVTDGSPIEYRLSPA